MQSDLFPLRKEVFLDTRAVSGFEEQPQRLFLHLHRSRALVPTNHLDPFRIQVRRLRNSLERATHVALLGDQHTGVVDLLELE